MEMVFQVACPLLSNTGEDSERYKFMYICTIIQKIKDYCANIDSFTGKPINAITTRDQVLYGSTEQECSGIVTCIWPTANVIRRAQELGANLIISHEAIFWNHGDHQDVVANNRTFVAKKTLLDEWGGTVWRCHDYIHAGVPLEADGSLVDGIFYGFAWKLGWTNFRVGDTIRSLDFKIPQTTGRKLAKYLVEQLGLNGTRLIGDPDAPVSRVRIPMHVMGGPADTATANAMDAENIDAFITMEFIDFTTCEYVRDAAMLGQGKCAITLGHFNLEEPGMEYMASWLSQILGNDAPLVTFVPMGDTYQYIIAE